LEPLGVAYVNYNSAALSASFDRPAGWGEEAPADSNVQFVEPEAVARVPYLSKLTVAMFTAGSKQDQNDAKVKLLEKLDELAQNGGWQEFKATDTSAASMANAQGHYAYYTATFGDIKVRGRMMVVAHGSALYMVRISSPADFYSLYEDVYRRVRTSWKFN
jgi:hypothetical protein